jgi:AcrR family transcriptional regulator
MSMTRNPKKRTYVSKVRQRQSEETRRRILVSAQKLFASKGFELITIDEIAKAAKVSKPSVYNIFQSKRGILLVLIDEALPTEQLSDLVSQATYNPSPRKRLEVTARICRQLYDAEKNQLDLLRGASILDPVFKELEAEREQRRYQRQEESVKLMAKENVMAENMSLSKARDILWTFTGRDFYRLLVLERSWSSDEYEQWLAKLLIMTLLKSAYQN